VGSRRTRIIGRVAIERDGRLLCVRHPDRDERGAFWCLPGGKADGDEGVSEAAVRELVEEVGVDVELDGILLVQDAPPGRCEAIFRGRLIGERDGVDDELLELGWFPIGDLPQPFHPQAFAELVQAAGSLAALPTVPLLRYLTG
jgi:8-oxo-dGTP pyrophosphatase MutT (NUDIX family)